MNHTPVTESEMSVEQALNELDRLFPDAKWITIAGDYTSRLGAPRRMSTRIFAAVQHPRFEAPTLSACMAQVRKWKQEQSS